MNAKYIWRSLELAKTPGFCVLCSGVIEAHSWLVILLTGPNRHDWVRAHKECAVTAAEVMGRPVDDPILKQPALPDEISLAEDSIEPTAVGRELSPAERYKAYRYGVFLRGQLLMRFTERRMMEGAVALLHQLEMHGLLSEPLDSERKTFSLAQR